MRVFRDDDDGYLAWIADHSDGHVINIARSLWPGDARVHRADCRTISGQIPRGALWTGPYVKVCAEHPAELEQWANNRLGEQVRLCGSCHPARSDTGSASRNRAERATDTSVPAGRAPVHGPVVGNGVVEAWADDYIRYEAKHRPPWQEQLRTEIRMHCERLKPSAGQVLHAVFFGDKRANADVENVVLYCFGSFSTAGSNGIRFEHGAGVPLTAGGDAYPFCYRYALAPRSGTFADWQQGRTLASFDWTDLGAFTGEKIAAQVWLALSRGQAEVAEQVRAPDRPFAVRVEVRPPRDHQKVLGNLVKGVFDGVISAFQAHTDTTVLPEVGERISKVVGAVPKEIEQHLLDRHRAVLGDVSRLVSPYGKGVQWNPADHWCVAGELLRAEPIDSHWAIKGEIVELQR